jgi:hypothetical protein
MTTAARVRPFFLRKRFWFGLFGTLALLALLWTVVVGRWLPGFAKPRIEAAASQALGAPFTIERLDIQPWTLLVTATGLRLGPAEAAWLQVDSVTADIAAESALRRAPVLSALTVRGPRAELERLEPGRFNITPMLEALRVRLDSGDEGGEPTRFALNNIRLVDGALRLVDRVAAAEHKIEGVQLGVPFLSNLPSDIDIEVEPLFDAVVNGSQLAIRGKSVPFAADQESTADIDWRDIDLPVWLEAVEPLLPQPLPVRLEGGRLALNLQLSFKRVPVTGAAQVSVLGTASVNELKLSSTTHPVTLQLPRLEVSGLEIEPLARRLTVGDITVQAPVVDLDVARWLAGGGAATKAATSKPKAAARSAAPKAAAKASGPGAPETDSAPWHWQVVRVVLDDGRVVLREPRWPKGEQQLTAIDLTLAGIDSATDKPPVDFKLSLQDAQGAKAQVHGSLDPWARRATADLALETFKPLAWLRPWQDGLPVRVLSDSTLHFHAQAEAGADGWRLNQGALDLDAVRLAPRPSAGVPAGGAARRVADDELKLRKLAVEGIEAEGGAQPTALRIASLDVDGLEMRASRQADGGLPWQGGSPPSASTGETAPAAQAPGTATAAAAAPSFSVRVAQVRCTACAATVLDRQVQPAVSIAMTRADLTLGKLDSDLSQRASFKLDGTLQGKGKLQLQGDVRPKPLALRSKIDVASLDLRVVQPYIEPFVNVSLAGALFGAAGEVQLEGSEAAPLASLQYRGRAQLADVRALDKVNEADFLRFKALRADGLDLQWTPADLVADLGAVSLDDFYGRLIIDNTGRINLRDIVKRESGDANRSITTPTDNAASAAPAGEAAAHEGVASGSGAPKLRWRSVSVKRGLIDFTDNFIRPNVSARLTDIAGDVSALAWDAPKPANVKMTGKVDGGAPLEIAGTVHPLGAQLYTDVTAEARGIELTRLSAYAGRYAGYGIEKGTLSMKLRYKVEDGRLNAENNLYLDQLTFGEKVDSPDALKLPVQLAVALLKDRNGVIDVNLPVSGSLNDPQFSIGGIIVRVLVNLITKAVTSPFALIANTFGGAQQELGFVAFEPGSSQLSSESRARLDTLAKGLVDRPGLRLEATGHADPVRDLEALRREHIDGILRRAKARETGDAPDDVRVEASERGRWLEAAYKNTEFPDKPRNLFGLPKKLEPAEMEAMLMRSAPSGVEPLRRLANQRADQVKAYLTQAKVPSERVLLTGSQVAVPGQAGASGDAPLRVNFQLK